MKKQNKGWLLTNTLNGKSAHCPVIVPAYSACYANHGDLMKWAKKTGCTRLLKKVWDGEHVEPFIAVNGETTCGFAVYRNRRETFYSRFSHKVEHYYRDYCENEDELAFWAEELAA